MRHRSSSQIAFHGTPQWEEKAAEPTDSEWVETLEATAEALLAVVATSDTVVVAMGTMAQVEVARVGAATCTGCSRGNARMCTSSPKALY